MAKVMVFVLVALLSFSLISASIPKSCKRHGDPCVADSECCGSIKCHKYANRCKVEITAEELMAQREKILGRKGKDY